MLAPSPVPVLLAVNAQTPDGKDTSWLWDVDYRVLRGRPVLRGRRTAAGPGGPAGGRSGRFELVDGIDDAVGRVPAASST